MAARTLQHPEAQLCSDREKGHEKGAVTPSGNTPSKGNDTPKDAKK